MRRLNDCCHRVTEGNELWPGEQADDMSQIGPSKTFDVEHCPAGVGWPSDKGCSTPLLGETATAHSSSFSPEVMALQRL
ncbi:hypothetical protein AAFF_G00375000 [Aldrovandia affinis]|uniref:Uncharacterized protein n=1 Tax=Aldrovandia affinis TaxID=143900 RepID=A0AAD7SG30_9TELE|nr:hypothetical protein AAFF_G00375000 [Aldrovandia affinis]